MKTAVYPEPYIMIADDSEPALRAVKEMLEREGLGKVITCNDSRQVMKMISSYPVGLTTSKAQPRLCILC